MTLTLNDGNFTVGTLESERRFRQRHARLFPLLDRGLATPKGTGTLLQAFASVARVKLRGQEMATNFHPDEIFPFENPNTGTSQ